MYDKIVLDEKIIIKTSGSVIWWPTQKLKETNGVTFVNYYLFLLT